MARSKYKLETDKAGNWHVDVPLDSGSKSVRVGFRRWYLDPPVGDDGTIQVERLAEQLETEFTGGTLRIENLFEHEGMRFPVEIDLESRDDLEVLIRAIRKVYKEGLRRNNAARRDGLARCRARLAERSAARERHSEDHGSAVERRRTIDRRSTERRRWYSPPANDKRETERRSGIERRAVRRGRVA
jgi:hypothetical protein